MPAKLLPPIQPDAIIKKLLSDLARLNKQQNACHIAETDTFIQGTVAFIQVNTSEPGWVQDEFSALIRKHRNTELCETRTYPGHYDWSAGVYIKDCATFKITLRP